MTRKITVKIPALIAEQLQKAAISADCSGEEIAETAINRHLSNSLKNNALFISAPVNALVEGIYKENTNIAELSKHGDFGLGTFNDLDGEMVILDGKTYQVKSDGLVYGVDDSVLSPFACITFFRALTHEDIDEECDNSAFNKLLQEIIPSPNVLYAVRVEGMFSHVKTRSVPKQDNYRPLVEVAKNQPIFNFKDIEGFLVGFYTPAFMASINVPGYHLHFLSSDFKHGGHLLECSVKKARIGFQIISKLELGLPITLDFLMADLNRDTAADLHKTEK